MELLRTNLYFEAHITLDPSALDRPDELKKIADALGFRIADLIKQNGDPSNRDAFMTLRKNCYHLTKNAVVLTVESLKKNGFIVKRAKVENTIMDTNVADEYGLGIGKPVEWYHYRYQVDDCVYEREFRSKVKDLDQKPELWATESPYGADPSDDIVKDDSAH